MLTRSVAIPCREILRKVVRMRQALWNDVLGVSDSKHLSPGCGSESGPHQVRGGSVTARTYLALSLLARRLAAYALHARTLPTVAPVMDGEQAGAAEAGVDEEG